MQGIAISSRFLGMPRFHWLLPLAFTLQLFAREANPLPAGLSDYKLVEAPETEVSLLKKGDRLAICGDSITEQKRYSVLLETYLTACLPELEITCRQYGWSGEQAGGFLERIESDVLRFKPTIATTCYGMNDFRYVPYNEANASEYRKNQTAIIGAFKGIGCRVVLGSPGIIDSVPPWVKTASGTKQELNLCLSQYRNMNVEISKANGVAFADIYQPMLIANAVAQKQYGADFRISGKDGVHPGWAGHVLITYGFLKGMGVDGNLGSVIYDEAAGKATATDGHDILSVEKGVITLRSKRLPFSPGPGVVDNDDSIRAGMALVPFDDELNRFTLSIKSPKSANYTILWGEQSRHYTASQLIAGINLAKDFSQHPLVPAFTKIQDAVAKKQAYETQQIKKFAHGEEGKADLEATFARTEKEREPLQQAIINARQPTDHTLTITAIP